MASMGDVAALASLAGALVALAFAVFIWRANPSGRRNRHLALLLLAESIFQGTIILSFWGRSVYFEIFSQWISITVLSAAFLLFATTLEGPLARAMARRTVRVGIGVACLGILAWCLLGARAIVAAGGTEEQVEDAFGWPWVAFALASLVSLVVSVDAFRSTPVGSPLRRKARAYALAFGLRDALYASIVAWWAYAEFVLASPAAAEWSNVIGGLTTVVFVVLLAYGILSTQLFDVDLKIKMGISRGTVASFALAVVFAISKVVELYASRTLGFVAGGVAAGLLMFAAPRLNKLGEKVANTAMPTVQPTSQYVAYKKLEVYRAAVESAVEGDRQIDAAERAMLDRLRVKLGVPAEDAKALEDEMLSASS